MDEEPRQVVPTIDVDDEEMESLDIEYSDRAVTDWVASGPLGEARGNGRRFPDWEAAERWARRFHGKNFKGRVPGAPEDSVRWCFLISRGEGN